MNGELSYIIGISGVLYAIWLIVQFYYTIKFLWEISIYNSKLERHDSFTETITAHLKPMKSWDKWNMYFWYCISSISVSACELIFSNEYLD